VVAGEPSLEATAKIIDTLVEAGADAIELGVPFTDAMADGPVIQAASDRAARRGVTVDRVLELAENVRRKHPHMALIVFSYFNPLLKKGLENFADQARVSGVDAVLTVDLPPEEAKEHCRILHARNIGTVFLASPTTESKRLKVIDALSTDFIYCISRLGTTGARSELASGLAAGMKRIRSQTSKPLALGFGISDARQAAEAARLADGVIVGSAFVKLIAESPVLEDSLKHVGRLAREIKEALLKETKLGASSL
jgi:tryptophan synthase alpha chain